MIPGINGQTLVYGVVGDPIDHSFSPQIHHYFASLQGINLAYVPFRVTAADLPKAVAGAYALGIRGLNITLPHKRAALALAARSDPTAAWVGAVNTLVGSDAGYIGHNTDLAGVTRTVEAAGLSFAHRPVAVLGAGGSAYAACAAAALGHASRITLFNRTPGHTAVLADHLRRHFSVTVQTPSSVLPAEPGAIVIQTTTLGFGAQAGQSPIRDPAFFSAAALAFDLIYTPWETAFLRQAKDAGIPTVNGFPMLVYQAAAAFTLWHGTDGGLDSDERVQEAINHLSAQYRRKAPP